MTTKEIIKIYIEYQKLKGVKVDIICQKLCISKRKLYYAIEKFKKLEF